MPLADWLLPILLSLAPYGADHETPIDREIRMTVIADAIAAAVTEAEVERPREVAAMLVAAGWWESRFALHVHEGRCRVSIGECDHGRARSPWQLHRSARMTADEWATMNGADFEATRLAALHAARTLAAARGRCGSVEGAFALYATGSSCHWSGAAARVRLTQRILAH